MGCWKIHWQQSNVLAYCAIVYDGLLESTLTAVKRSSLLHRCVRWGAGNYIKSSQTFKLFAPMCTMGCWSNGLASCLGCWKVFIGLRLDILMLEKTFLKVTVKSTSTPIFFKEKERNGAKNLPFPPPQIKETNVQPGPKHIKLFWCSKLERLSRKTLLSKLSNFRNG